MTGGSPISEPLCGYRGDVKKKQKQNIQLKISGNLNMWMINDMPGDIATLANNHGLLWENHYGF